MRRRLVSFEVLLTEREYMRLRSRMEKRNAVNMMYLIRYELGLGDLYGEIGDIYITENQINEEIKSNE